ncbi:BACON domain-containing protein [Roseovarius pacificus]|uniref:BACON domain-containing protein n=1 Tax=Roseovarius pacificus TaxID=337701 RepID=UPI002A18DB52|nr:BACON domain-containing carbohydrate-binding protein [Roseovarius pacificus]
MAFAQPAAKASRAQGSKAADSKIDAGLAAFQAKVAGEVVSRAQAKGVAASNLRALGLMELSEPLRAEIDAGGEVQVYAVVDAVTSDHVAALAKAGLRVEMFSERMKTVQGWVRYDQLETLAALDFVERLKLPSYGITRTGSVNSEGDALLNADDVRALPSPGPYTGAGIKLGIISDGADTRATAIASGDLPSGGVTIHPTFPGSGDEGTAMLEIVHDLAPGAELYFGGGLSSSVAMANVIDWMANTVNCDVICDDLGFYAEPYFEDGDIANTARDAVLTSGRVYCSSAGNSADDHWQGLFADPGAGTSVGGKFLHDWKTDASVDQFLDFQVSAGGTITFVLQWDDAFGASGNDYDFYIINSAYDAVLASSTAGQNGNDDPLEIASYTNNTGAAVGVAAGVILYSGAVKTIELFALRGSGADDDISSADSIFGHPAVTEVLSCASINQSDPGTDTIAYYSSRGPSTMVYPSAVTRGTPFVTAVDGVSITGAGGFPNPFYGTSASAPHVAAISALILSANPSLTPAQVQAAISTSAVDLGTAGFDNTFGWGRIDALGAVNSLCSYSIAPTSRNVAATGVTGATVDVTAPSGCVWAATSNAGWITVTGGATGSGNGQVSYNVAANTGPARNGIITVAGETHTVSQADGCTYGISPSIRNFSAAGGSGATIDVTSGAGCAWTATSNNGWLTVTGGGSGTGSGQVTYSVAANTGPARTGTITAAGQTHTVTQSDGCTYGITPGTRNVGAGGGSGFTVDVTTNVGCTWTSVSNDLWITVTGGASGTGSGQTVYLVTPNLGPSRTGSITVAGQTHTVTQSGGCTYSATPSSRNFTAAGGSGATIDITAGLGCAWTAVSNDAWITVTGGASGSGNGQVTYSVAANTGPARMGTITAASETHTVTQADGCTFGITPANRNVGAPGGAGFTIDVTTNAGCTWTAVSNAGWITLTGGASGTGSGQAVYSVTANTGPQRTGTVTVAGQTHTVVQADGCAFTVAPPSRNFTEAGGSGATIDITTSAGCAWTAVSNDAWITVTGGGAGTGPGQVLYAVSANTGPARSGSITAGGQTHTVTQDDGCTFGVTPGSRNVGASGGSGFTVDVTTNASCPWTAISNDSWITVTAGASITGTGQVTYSVSANTGPQRTGTVTIAGQTHTVVQADGCTFSIAPPSRNFTVAGGSGATIDVTTSTGCAWTAVSNDSWIIVTGSGSGTGPGQVLYAVSANTGPARSGSITAAGQTHTVTQDDGCTYAVSPGTRGVSDIGATGLTVSVNAGAGCVWNATSNAAWLIITAGNSGTGNGTVTYTVSVNTGPQRVGTVDVEGETHTVTQDAGCTYVVSPGTSNVGETGASGLNVLVSTETGCAWAATPNAGWITIAGSASGTGPGSVTFDIAANSGPQRVATITIEDQTHTITQDTGCTYAIAPGNNTVGAGGVSGATVDVSTVSGCTWTAVSNNGWITVAGGASGSGNGQVTYDVAANIGPARTGTITVAGETHTVNQADGCTFAIAPSSQSVAASGATGASLGVTAGVGCAWTAVSNDSWITVTAGGSGTGNGSVTYDVAPTTGPARSGTITVAGETHTVNQASGCTYAINPGAQNFPAAGGTGASITVTAGVGCAWTAVSNDGWVTVTGGAAGTGNGTVSFDVAANAGPARSGSVTVAGETYTVTQDDGCTFAIAPTAQNFAASGATGASLGVTAGTGCAWTAVSNDGWITVTGGGSSSGNGSVTYDVAATAGPARTGTISVAGQTYTVNQASGCTFAISPGSQNFSAAGGTGASITVTAGTGCAWTAVSNDGWVTVASGNAGSGNGSVTFEVAANTGPARTGTLTVAGETFTVTQDDGCIFAIDPVAQNVGPPGASGLTVDVTTASGCAWTAVSNDSWITVSAGATGAGSGTVTYAVAANTGPARAGTVTVAGQTHAVSQSSGCTYAITPGAQNFVAAGGTGASISVTAGAGCTWSAVSNDGWITVTGGSAGNGNGSVTFDVAANTGPARAGTLTVAGETFVVTQDDGCSFIIGPMAQNVSAAGATGLTVAVTSAAGCAWTGVSNDAWITVTGGAASIGSGQVVYSVAPNTGPERIGTLTIAGELHVVTQADGCVFTLSPPGRTVSTTGTTGQLVTVTTPADCPWTATATAAWITITAGNSGAGPGAVTYAVATNTGPERTATIDVAGESHEVTQLEGCGYVLTPPSRMVGSSGGSGFVIAVATEAGCVWAAAPNVPWVTITSGMAGSGPGTVVYSVAANAGAPRIGSIEVAGVSHTVFQDAPSAGALTLADQLPGMVERRKGASYTYSITAVGGTGPLDYVWYHITDDKALVPVGGNASSVTLGPLDFSDAGGYFVEVSDSLTTVTSNTSELIVLAGLPAANRLVLVLCAISLAWLGARQASRRRRSS